MATSYGPGPTQTAPITYPNAGIRHSGTQAQWTPGKTATVKPAPKTPPRTTSTAPIRGTADAALLALFNSYGLGSLARVLVDFAKKGYNQDESYLRLRETKEYQTRFAGNIERQKKFPHLSSLSEAEYIDRERGYEQIMRSYGLPKGFYDQPADYAKLIGANVGSQELQNRLEARKAIVTDGAHTGVLDYAKQKYGLAEGDPHTGVLDYAKQKYGLAEGDLIAYFIDPQRATPMLEKIAAASQIGAAAARVKWGDVTRAEAERLAALGINANQAQAGYGQAAELAGLAEGPTDGVAATSRQDLQRAVLEDDAEAKRRVARTQEARTARFSGGGAYASSRSGFAGLGSANTQ